VGDSGSRHRNFAHVAPGPLRSFPNSFGNFACFTDTDTHTPVTVTDNHTRPEAKAATPFNHLGCPRNMNYALIEFFYRILKFTLCHKILPN
jgi:hypothetical protein